MHLVSIYIHIVYTYCTIHIITKVCIYHIHNREIQALWSTTATTEKQNLLHYKGLFFHGGGQGRDTHKTIHLLLRRNALIQVFLGKSMQLQPWLFLQGEIREGLHLCNNFFQLLPAAWKCCYQKTEMDLLMGIIACPRHLSSLSMLYWQSILVCASDTLIQSNVGPYNILLRCQRISLKT